MLPRPHCSTGQIDRSELYIILVGVVTEMLQLIRLDKLLHLDGTAWGVILGSTFDIRDLVCDVAGGVLFPL